MPLLTSNEHLHVYVQVHVHWYKLSLAIRILKISRIQMRLDTKKCCVLIAADAYKRCPYSEGLFVRLAFTIILFILFLLAVE